LDVQAKATSKVPGPADYQPEESRDFALPEGGRLNRHPPAQRYNWADEGGFLKYEPTPGFAATAARPADRGRHAKHGFGSGGALSRQPLDALAKAMVEMPGPAQYQGAEFQEAAKSFCPEGGRFSSVGRDSDFTERASRHTAAQPGPGQYDEGLPTAINGNKGHGKVVWRYESATISDSKKLVTKAMGVRNEPPGPGAYTLPDPPPIAHPPSIKGRNGGAMPHIAQAQQPSIHNPLMAGLSPDSLEKFTRIREKNSGDQIFGRDLRKGTAAAKGGAAAHEPGSRPGTGGGDRVHPNEMPISIGASVFDAPDENAVQWKAGGFSVIKKSKSSSAVQHRRDHPAMEAAQKQYPTLSRLHKREGHGFLPMATRKNNGFTAVPTHEDCTEHQQLCRSKWTLAEVLDNLSKVTASALEPLDEEKMREQALQHLKDHAEERMRLEGVASEQQALVMAELPLVFEEKVLKSSQHLKPQSETGSPNNTVAEFEASQMDDVLLEQQATPTAPPA